MSEQDTTQSSQSSQSGQPSQGGITKDKLLYIASLVEEHNANLAEERGELGVLMKDFEEKGGHKKALRTALSLKAMETSKAQDFWRSLEQYMDMMGIFDQHDLFDPVVGQDGHENKVHHLEAAE